MPMVSRLPADRAPGDFGPFRACGVSFAGFAPFRSGQFWPEGLTRPDETLGKWKMSETRDSNGALLNEGDNVTVIKDLKVKGSSIVLKRGTMVRGIHLTDDPEEIEGRTDKVKGLVLKTCFLKKS
jgi:protein PhnA